MEDKGRIENPAIREYIYKFATEKLEQNPDFVKVFGTNFARKRIKANLIVVYTNELMSAKNYLGYHNGTEKSITICNFKNKDNLLTPEEIEEDEKLQETVLHESIHAILNLTKKDFKKYGVIGGTGLLKRFYSQNGSVKELGRGLNEGFTEWLCGTCGYYTRSYEELTNFVKLIEVAVGREKTMELGKGNFQDRFSIIFDMPDNEVNRLLAISDDVYQSDEEYKYIIEVQKYLEELVKESKKDINENEDKENSQYFSETNLSKISSAKKLEYTKTIEKYNKDPLYLKYLKDNNLEHSNETLISYIEDYKLPYNREEKRVSIVMMESALIDKYFKKDLEQIFNSKSISKEDFEKAKNIISCLNTNLNKIPEIFEYMKPEQSSIAMKKEYENFYERYCSQVVKSEIEKYKKGELDLKTFIANTKELCGSNYSDIRKFINEFSRNVEPEFIDELSNMLDIAWRFSDSEEYLKNLIGASVYKLVSEDSSRNLTTSLLYDKTNFCNRYSIQNSIIRSPEQNVEFDFTSGMDEVDEYSVAMKNFIELRDKVFQKNPNAKIHIVSREVIVRDGDNLSFYQIDRGELVPMRIEKKVNFNFIYEEKEEEHKIDNYPTVQPKIGIWARVINKIKRKLNDFINGGTPGPSDYVDDKKEVSSIPISTDSKLDFYKVNDFDEKIKAFKKQHESVEERNENNEHDAIDEK